ncbi:hypothetical protein I545_1248 [Mycobacterium kansasii 662]|uniref:Uncharacterized protein n=1 Tax=Mycobacterium kansasii 662 TaxID=1299326 RepID=X7ZQF1_MYCKA|nr:hypothetical protein I545_1248 [Mycobacterium kansasii 662]
MTSLPVHQASQPMPCPRRELADFPPVGRPPATFRIVAGPA